MLLLARAEAALHLDRPDEVEGALLRLSMVQPSHRIPSRMKLARLAWERRDWESAVRLCRNLLSEDALDPLDRSLVESWLSAVEPISRMKSRLILPLGAGHPLPEGTRVMGPLRMCPGDSGLEVVSFAGIPSMIAIPIRLPGGPIRLRVEGGTEYEEWASRFCVALDSRHLSIPVPATNTPGDPLERKMVWETTSGGATNMPLNRLWFSTRPGSDTRRAQMGSLMSPER